MAGDGDRVLSSRFRTRLLGAIAFAACPTQALAQQSPSITPRAVAVERIVGVAGHPELYEVAQDGNVFVDWKRVEAMATAPSSYSGRDVALMMLALRDRTWKRFDERQ